MALRDFLKRLHIREKITTSHEYLFDVINLMAEGILVTDSQGVIIFCNTQVPKLLHRTEKKIINAHLSEVFKKTYVPKTKAYVAGTKPTQLFPTVFQQRVLKQKKALTEQDIVYYYRSREAIFSANIRPVFDAKNEIETVIISLREVTKRRTNQENQVQFARVMGHELKHPLASMKAYVHFIRKLSDPTNSKIRSYLQKTDHQVNTLVKMINDLLDISKISTNKLAVDLRSRDLTTLVEETVKDLRPVHTSHALHFVGTEPVYAKVDDLRLQQVVTNLVSNAVKYSPEGSPVTVQVFKKEKKASISVTDKGSGVDEASMASIFEPYTRLDVHKKVKGLGLGLYISKNIVDKHNGALSVKNNPAKGATFTVELPLDDQKHA